MNKLVEHTYILMTVLFTVYSQLIMRWQVAAAGPLPADTSGKVGFILGLLINPWVLSGVVATFLAGVSWMLVMTKFEISYAYPFVSLNYIFVFVVGILVFNEPVSWVKLAGTALVILGLIVIAKG